MEYPVSLSRGALEDYQHHQMFLQQFLLQCYPQKEANGFVQCQEWGGPRLRPVTRVLLRSHRLDNDAQDNRQEKTGHQMDTNVFA